MNSLTPTSLVHFYDTRTHGILCGVHGAERQDRGDDEVQEGGVPAGDAGENLLAELGEFAAELVGLPLLRRNGRRGRFQHEAHRRPDVLELHGGAVRIQDENGEPVAAPVAAEILPETLVQLIRGHRLMRSPERRGLGAHEAERNLRRLETEPESP